jgi:hypothetical protein
MFESALDKSMGITPPDKSAPPAELEVPEKLDVDDDKPEDEKKPESEEEPTEESPPKTYKVKIDGKEVEVAEDELLKGYSRQSDYTKKSMEVAEQRRQIEGVAARFQEERAQYQNQLNQLTQALGQELNKQVNWEQLLETDPVEYLKQQHLYNQRQAAYQQSLQAQAQYAQQTREQEAMNAQQRLQYEREQLVANLPAWKDEATAAKEGQALTKHLIERGYSEQQIRGLTDHKTLILARESMLYRQMMAKAKETTKVVEKLPPRMEKPGVARPTDGRTSDMTALRKSGKVEDAAALFAKLF